MTSGNGSRVLMIGLDSADLDYVEPRLGSFPNLRRLFTEGTVHRLQTPADTMSACVWPTFFTGLMPGGHGQYFPIQWDPASMQLRHVDRDWLDCDPFWRPLAREGLPVTTLDVQMVFPNKEPHGVELVNWASKTLGPFHCNNPEVGKEVERLFGTHVLQPDIPVEKSPERSALIRKTLIAATKRRGDLSRWLLQNTDWKLFITVFQESHRVGHYFWKDSEAGTAAAPDSDASDVMLEVHQALDREVGELVRAADSRDTTVIVFSLMGMGANRAQMHLVPEIVERINRQYLEPGAVTAAAPPRRKRSVMGYLRDHLPAPIQERIGMLAPASVRDWVVGRAYAGALDWKKTPGFALPTGGEGYLRANLVGRENEGYLEPGSAAHRRYLDALREGFLSLRRAETGEPLADEVLFPAERYPGPRSKYLPDISVTWRPGGPASTVTSETLGTFTGRLKTGRDGNHRPAAFASITGPGRSSPRVASLENIADLAGVVRDLTVGPPSRPA
jgi:predicted AlkP superfamily phosphohydrolase/phosphomutase